MKRTYSFEASRDKSLTLNEIGRFVLDAIDMGMDKAALPEVRINPGNPRTPKQGVVTKIWISDGAVDD